MQKLLGFFSMSLVCIVLASAVGCPSKDKDKDKDKPGEGTKTTKNGKSLAINEAHAKVEQGKSVDVEIVIVRTGFEDDVVMKVEAPANLKVTPGELKFAKNETKHTVKVDADAKADAKDHELKLTTTSPEVVKDAKGTAKVTVTKKS